MTSPVERITTALAAEMKRQESTTNVWEHDGKTWASVGYDGPYMSESSGEVDIELTAIAAAVLAALELTEEWTVKFSEPTAYAKPWNAPPSPEILARTQKLLPGRTWVSRWVSPWVGLQP